MPANYTCDNPSCKSEINTQALFHTLIIDLGKHKNITPEIETKMEAVMCLNIRPIKPDYRVEDKKLYLCKLCLFNLFTYALSKDSRIKEGSGK